MIFDNIYNHLLYTKLVFLLIFHKNSERYFFLFLQEKEAQGFEPAENGLNLISDRAGICTQHSYIFLMSNCS